MKLKSWDETREIEFFPCPFCGGEPVVHHIGNDYRNKKAIEVKCTKCRVTRKDATLRFDFSWLEGVAQKNWNQLSVESRKSNYVYLPSEKKLQQLIGSWMHDHEHGDGGSFLLEEFLGIKLYDYFRRKMER